MVSDPVDLFLAICQHQPEAPAIVAAGQTLTYAALERRVRTYAGLFARAREPRVLMALSPGFDAYAAILAAGLAGGFHTPLNVAAPLAKRQRIAGLLEPDVILCEPGAVNDYAGFGATLLTPDALPDAPLFEGGGTRHHLAYVIFTSGSTGVPKGVQISRAALGWYVDWLRTLGFGPGDRVSQQPNLAFDISMTDIFGALCFGAALYPLTSRRDVLMPALFIQEHAITVWNSTPSAVSLMMQLRQVTPETFASLRLVNFCGEPLLPEHLDAIFAARPDLIVQNTYGPTEATISMTALRLTAEDYRQACGTSVAIGAPIPGMGIELVGGTHPNEGQIVITGRQLANGYFKDPSRSAEVFKSVATAAGPQPGYYTGDWAERHDGNLFFKERIDFQVKIRGHRIELDEVTAAIRAFGWPVACAFKQGERLCAVIEAVNGQVFDEKALRDSLADKIDAYAIPDHIRLIDRMPRNENDKLDRKAAMNWFAEHAWSV